MPRLNDILKSAQKDFQQYARKKGLEVKDDPFDIELVHVQILKDEAIILDREVPINRLGDIPKYLREVDLDAYTLAFEDEHERFEIKITDLDDITKVIDAHKDELFKKFGVVCVKFYRDNNELFDVCVNNLKDLINIIKDNEDKFRGLRDAEKRRKFDKRYTDGGDGVGLILVNNVIIDEFNNAIADENGNCLSFE
jgi:hypothetical protein